MVTLVIPDRITHEVAENPRAMAAIDREIRNSLRRHQKPPNHTYAGVLGKARRRMTLEESVAKVLKEYPRALGGVVTGSTDHRSYWHRGKLVAHAWPADGGLVWLRIRENRES